MRCWRRTDTRSRDADFSSTDAEREGKSNAVFRVDADPHRNRIATFPVKNGRVFPLKFAFACNPLNINHLPLGTFGLTRASKGTEGEQNFDENAFATDQGNGGSGFSENPA